MRPARPLSVLSAAMTLRDTMRHIKARPLIVSHSVHSVRDAKNYATVNPNQRPPRLTSTTAAPSTGCGHHARRAPAERAAVRLSPWAFAGPGTSTFNTRRSAAGWRQQPSAY
jgi:hypothetical protein